MQPGLTIVDTTGSTNDDARKMVEEGVQLPVCVLARTQTRGRGRGGNVWLSPQGGLYLSCAVEMDPSLRQWYGPASAVWVAEAVEEATGVSLDLKWPNDFLIKDRKVGGQLLEAFVHGDRWVVIAGIGLNCNVTPRLDDPDAFPPISLAEISGTEVDVEGLARNIVKKFNNFNRLQDLIPSVRQGYLGRLSTLGRRVRVSLPSGQAIEGVASDVTEDFALVVDTGRSHVTVTAGDLVHLRHAPSRRQQ